jgi:hypothetical protein
MRLLGDNLNDDDDDEMPFNTINLLLQAFIIKYQNTTCLRLNLRSNLLKNL